MICFPSSENGVELKINPQNVENLEFPSRKDDIEQN
jgi:hypothetical protein